MSKIRYLGRETGMSLYAFRRKVDGTVWNGSAYVAYDPMAWASYAVDLPETPAGGRMYVSADDAETDDLVEIFERAAAGTEASGDQAIAGGEMGDVGGLTAQEVRDAMKLAPTAGSPAAGSVDAELDTVSAKTNLITAGGITIRSMIVGPRYIEIAKGYDHPASEGLALIFPDEDSNWGDYSGAAMALEILDRSNGDLVVSIAGTYAAGPPKTITFEPTVSETEDLSTGHRAYGFQLVITPSGGEPFLRAWGDVTVLSYWP